MKAVKVWGVRKVWRIGGDNKENKSLAVILPRRLCQSKGIQVGQSLLFYSDPQGKVVIERWGKTGEGEK